MKHLLKAKSEFRKKGVRLVADKMKQGGGGSWKFAGEDNFIKTIQQPLTECGLEYAATLEAMPELNLNMVVGTLYHIESGEFIQSKKIIDSPKPKTDKNGNLLYLDAEIEAGKQFGYWSRILGIRLLGISDVDPEDVNNMPEDISDDAVKKREELNELIGKSSDQEKTKKWICDTYKVTSIESLHIENVKHVVTLLKQKK